MNTYSLRSKKSRQSSTAIIDLSLDSDDDDDEFSISSDTIQYGMIPPKDTNFDMRTHYDDGRCCKSLSTSSLVTTPRPGKCSGLVDKADRKVAATSSISTNTEDADVPSQEPVLKALPKESERHHACEQNSTGKEKLNMVQPDVTTSNGICISEVSVYPIFDEADYTNLCQRYLTPRTRNKPELPDGMILRRQYRGRIIDANTPLYRKLRVKVDAWLRKNNHEEVYRVLCQLRDWELDPRRVPTIFQRKDDADVAEVFDLTSGNDEPSYIECIDVDECITTRATSLGSSIPGVVLSSEHFVSKVSFDDEPTEIGEQHDLDSISVPVTCVDLTQIAKRSSSLIDTLKVNAHAPMKTHPTRTKLSKTTFHEWLAKKKESWRKRRNRCHQEQGSSTLIWSPSSLRTASHRVKKAQAQHVERLRAIQSDKQTLLNTVKCEGSNPNTVIPSAALIVSSTSKLRVAVPPNISSGSCNTPSLDIHPSSPVKLSAYPTIPQVVTPDGKDTHRKAFVNKQNRVSQKSLPMKRRLYADGKLKNGQHSSTRSRAFTISDFGFPNRNHSIYWTKYSKGCNALGLVQRTDVASHAGPAHHSSRSRNRRHGRLYGVVTTADKFAFSIIPSVRVVVATIQSNGFPDTSLQKEWNTQITKRKRGEWIPRGHVTGRWKPPDWANVLEKRDFSASADSISTSNGKKSLGCRKNLLPVVDDIMESYAVDVLERPSGYSTSSNPSASLQDVICPHYVKPTMDLLRNAHAAVSSLLPVGDCEDWEVVELARRYYDYWRPKETKVILLAESHAFTSKVRALNGPGLDKDMLNDTYFGPREFISLVYCLSYGENESLTANMNDKSNKGTPQFWTLLAACARGVEYVACTQKQKPSSSPFATDLLKGGNLPVEERLRAKLAVLEDLRRRGIWLLDTSVFGWYISQPQAYKRSRISNEIHRKQKSRPPSELKTPSLVLSWELFTKHVVREVAEEGHLKYLIPIGMEVEAAVTRKRMEDAIQSSKSEEAQVSDTFPAPNAWIPGGYGPFHAKLAALVNEAAPSVA